MVLIRRVQVAAWVQRNKKQLRNEFSIKTVADLVKYASANNFLTKVEDREFGNNETAVVLIHEGKLLNKRNELEAVYTHEHLEGQRPVFQQPEEFTSLLRTLRDARSADCSTNQRVIVCVKECIAAARNGTASHLFSNSLVFANLC